MTSNEKPFRFFRPISFDQKQGTSFHREESIGLAPNIRRPVPQSPRKGFCLGDAERSSFCQYNSDEETALDSLHQSSTSIGEVKVPESSESLHEPINLEVSDDHENEESRGREPLRPENIFAPFKYPEAPYADELFGESEEILATNQAKPEKEEKGSILYREIHSAVTEPAVDRSEQLTSSSSLPRTPVAPMTGFSNCSLNCSEKTANRPSLNTDNSNSSKATLAQVNPAPRHMRVASADSALIVRDKKVRSAAESSSSPDKCPLGHLMRLGDRTSPLDDIPVRLFAERNRSVDASGRFRRLVSNSRQRSGTEPWIFNKKSGMASSSSSTAETDDTSWYGPKALLERKSSSKGSIRGSGPLAALKLRKSLSRNTEGDDSNPWFQERSDPSPCPDISDDESGLSLAQEAEGVGIKFEKVKRKRLKRKIARQIFSKEKDGKNAVATNQGSSSSRSSQDILVPPSPSNDSQKTTSDVTVESIVSSAVLEKDLRKALSAKRRLEDVLERALVLRERPPEDLCSQFYKYLSSSTAVERGVTIILNGGFTASAASMKSSFAAIPKHRVYSELLSSAYVNGPSRLRKAVLSQTKAKAQILAFLTQNAGDLGSRTETYSFKVRCLVKVLAAILAESPSDVTDFLSGSQGCLHSFVRYQIRVAEAADFICQLCAANALSDAPGDGLRYGAPNAAGIALLRKEGISDLLVRVFEESCETSVAETDSSARWQLQVMSMGCLVELSKRSVVVPKFSKNNCSYSNKHIKSLNAALQNIDLFQNVERASRLLRAALSCAEKTGRGSGQAEQGKDCNAGVCVLSSVAELLDMVSSAGDSKSVVTRRTVGKINTKDLERVLLSQIGVLCRLLDQGHEVEGRGRLSLEIVKVFRSLFESRSDDTRIALVDAGVPECVLRAVRKNKLCSILHGCVVECMAVSLRREESGRLHHEWLRALNKVGMLEEMASVLEGKCGTDKSEQEDAWSTYRSTLVDLGFVLCMFSQNLTRAAFRRLFESEQQYQTFIGKIEVGLGKVANSREGACGGPKPEGAVVSVLANADALAAKINDVDAV